MGLDTYLHLSAQESEQDASDQSGMPTLGNCWLQRTRPLLKQNGE